MFELGIRLNSRFTHIKTESEILVGVNPIQDPFIVVDI